MKRKSRGLLSLLLIVALLFSSTGIAAANAPTAATETAAVRVSEVEALRQTNAETYLMSDGTYECVVYSEDKYYYDSENALQRIDNSVVAAQSASGKTQYKNAANMFDVTFSSSGVPQIGISKQGKSITFSPMSASSGKNDKISTVQSTATVGKVENCTALDRLTQTGSNTVSYKNAFTGTDLVYVLENNALKEYIILGSADAPNTFHFLFDLDGVTLQTGDGVNAFIDSNGETMFALGQLFAVDAAGKVTEALSYTVTPVKETSVIVTVTLDSAYLSSAEREFPVVIDPSIVISSVQTADTCVCSGFPNTNYYTAYQLRTGYDSDYGIRRSYIKFDIPSTVPAYGVTMATLQIEKVSGATPSVRAYLVTGNWTSSTLIWNNRPGYNTAYESTLSGVQSNGTWYTMYVTDSVQSWVNGENPNYGFLLKDTYEADPDHWTTFYSSDASSPHKPELHIFYNQNTPVLVNRFYSTYSQTAEYREYLQYNMNCYGYALHVYSLQGSRQSPYKQQPGEFAIDDATYNELYSTYVAINEDPNLTGTAFLDFIEQKMEDDFSAFSSTTGATWIIQPTTRTASIPEGYRKIVLTVKNEIFDRDYHFYLRHSDGTWSHKQGATPVTNLSPDTNVVITDSNIASVATEDDYDDGVRYYLINKPAIIDYPHNFGQNGHKYTSTVFKDCAGALLETSTVFTGTSKMARFDYPDDVDCYVYTPAASKNYTVMVSEVNAEIQIYNAYGTCLADGGGQVTYPLVANHNYFIRIKYTTVGDYTVVCS